MRRDIDEHPALARALAKYSHKKWAQLPKALRIQIANSKGWDLDEQSEKLSKMWSKHRKVPKTVADAKKIVAEAEAEEAALDAAVAAAAPAATAPTAAEVLQITSNLAAASTAQSKQVADLAVSSTAQSKQIAAQSKQIADLADSTRNQFSDVGALLSNYGGRLTNVENRQDASDAWQENANGRLNELEQSVRVLSDQCPRDQRLEQQQQNDPDSQILAVGANAGEYASPPRAAPFNPSAPAFAPPSTGLAADADADAAKMTPPSPPSPTNTLDSGFSSDLHSNSDGSVGSNEGSVEGNDGNDRGATDVTVSTGPAFGSTFQQYQGFRTTTSGGGGGGGGGFAASTGFAGGSGGGNNDDDDDDDDDDGNVPKELFGTTGGGGFSSGSSLPSALVSTGNGDATATDIDIFGKGTVVDKSSPEQLLFSTPLNTLPPTLKAVTTAGGEAKWEQRSNSAKFKISVDPTKSSARLTMHDNGLHLVCNHLIHPNIKLDPYNKRDDAWVWTARDYSRNDSGTVTTFQLRFADARIAAAFGEKFKEAQEMITKK